jgi:benzoyl-CoA reductase/2-hydroxyglutaryl-CoA dehydratase subunit BcrC/BadD/HgdB
MAFLEFKNVRIAGIAAGVPENVVSNYTLKPGEDISNLIISKKTLFIDEDNSKISIKEVDGNISKVYNIIVPKDEKDIKIEELEKKIKELEERLDDKHAEHTVTDATIKSTTASANKSTKSATITTF